MSIMIIKKVVIIEGKRFVRFLFDPCIHYSVCRGDGIKKCRHWEESCSECSELCDVCDSIHKIIKGIRTSRQIKHYTYYGE
jgi:hypothetical protein